MTIAALRHLAESGRFDLGFMYYAGNARLRMRLEEIAGGTGRLDLLPLDYASRALQAFRSLVSFRRVRALAARMEAFRPALVVVAQGRIEGCTLGLLAARRAGLPLVSYLPLAHRGAVAGNPLLAPAKDLLNAHYYSIPDGYITIHESVAGDLRARGVNVPVAVVPNGLDLQRYHRIDKGEARRGLDLPQVGFVAAVVGRIHFRQKGQDFLVRALARYGDRLGSYHVVVVGEGPDLGRLIRLVRERGLAERVRFLPWVEDVSAVYSAVDAVVLPSRFEGVPLVMLEAMLFGLPIVGARVDAMATELPESLTYTPGDQRGCVNCLVNAAHAARGSYPVPEPAELDIGRFRQEFYDVMVGEIGRVSRGSEATDPRARRGCMMGRSR
jgi:glycosyltransferase involved in cell wall biosynthesis